jgi:hypothetical protein
MNCFAKKTKMNVAKGTALFLLGLLFLACGSAPAPTPAPDPVPAGPPEELDAAIRETSDYLNNQLPRGNKLVILNIQSDFPALSEYIIDELIANTVNDRVFSVVDRQQLDTIRAELDFQTSGEVDDETAQALGRLAGAQSIVSGAVSRIGDLYRLRVRALSVQTAQIEGQFNRNIPEGSTVTALINSKATGYGGGSVAARTQQGATPALAPAAQTPADPASAPSAILVQAEPAQPATPVPAPAPATYTTGQAGPAGGTVFYPVVRTTSVPPATTQDYKVGDTGPAGGIIFYVNPNAGEWKYLEAAPANTEKVTFWAAEDFPVDAIKDARSVGMGKSNTEYIMRAAVERGGGFDWAAEICDSLTVNGYDDWFLPSRDELHQMYGNLQRRGLGGFQSAQYWSSTPYPPRNWGSGVKTGAWYENFSNGEQNAIWNDNKDLRVRAIRQF